MNNQGWISWRLDIGLCTAALTVIAAVLCGVSTVAAESQETFDRLEALEREMTHHRRASSRAERALERLEQKSEEGFERGGLADRAHRRLRDRVTARLVGWEQLYGAAARRAPLARPGRMSDLQQLVSYAEREALTHFEDEYSTLDRLGSRRAEPAVFLHRRATTAVELAQHRASENAAAAEKEDVVEQAKRTDSEGLEEELEESQERLESSLRELIDHETGEDFHRRKGALLPPVDAEPAQGFGEKKQQHSMTYVRHTGISYRVEKGTTVQAVAEGLVVHAQRFEGYGNLVIVDHGDDYHSLYAHLSEMAVEEGDEIGQGERVGRTGATESLDGPKLYFELRADGEPIDPEPWFVRKE